MSVKGGCRAAPTLVTLAFTLLILANTCSWMAFTTTSWGFTDKNDHEGYGLWRKCSEGSICSPLDGIRLGWYQLFQGFGVLGFVGINVAAFLVILYMFVGSCQGDGEVIVGAIILCFLGAGSWLVSILLFNDRWQELITTPGSEKYLSYSFYLAIASAGIAFTCGLLLTGGMCCAGATSRGKVQSANGE